MPRPVLFDDLIPAARSVGGAGAVSFDDLIPGEGDRGFILPFEKDAEGNTSFAVPRILDPIIGAVNLPGEVMRGEVPVVDEQGNVTPEVTGRAVDFAAVFSPGSVASRARIAPSQQPSEQSVRVTRRVETPIQASARRQQVTMPRAATTERPVLADLARRTSDLPGVGQPLRRASQRAMQETGEAASRIVDDLGRGDVVSAGTSITDDIARYAGRGDDSVLGQRVARLYNEVDSLVDDAVQTPLRATARAVQRVQSARQASAIPGQSTAIRQVQDALDRGGLSYSGIKGLRTFYREALDNPPQLVSMGMQRSEAQAIYRALSDDLRAAVQQAGGPRALRAFERANRTALVTARERQALQAILGTGVERSPENIVSRLQRLAGSAGSADIATLTRVRRAVSRETWDDFASAILASMGRNPQTNDFSGTRFLTAWGKLSERGRQALFPDAVIRQNIDDLVTISTRFKRLDELGNFSNSGSLGAMTAAFAGGVIAPIQTLMALAGPTVFSIIMSRPDKARLATSWARAYVQAVTRPSVAASRLLAERSQALAVVLADESGTPQALRQIAETLRNPQTLAEQENEGDQQQPDAQPIQR